MSALVIRDLPDAARDRLERLAAAAGATPEAHAARLLADAVADPPPIEPLPEPDLSDLPDPPPRTVGDLLRYLDEKYPNAGFEEGEVVRIRGKMREVDLG